MADFIIIVHAICTDVARLTEFLSAVVSHNLVRKPFPCLRTNKYIEAAANSTTNMNDANVFLQTLENKYKYR